MFCSDCGWEIDQFFDLTKRQVRHFVNAKITYNEKINDATEEVSKHPDRKKKKKSKAPKKDRMAEAIEKAKRGENSTFEPNDMQEFMSVLSMAGEAAMGIKFNRGKK